MAIVASGARLFHVGANKRIPRSPSRNLRRLIGEVLPGLIQNQEAIIQPPMPSHIGMRFLGVIHPKEKTSACPNDSDDPAKEGTLNIIDEVIPRLLFCER